MSRCVIFNSNDYDLSDELIHEVAKLAGYTYKIEYVGNDKEYQYFYSKTPLNKNKVYNFVEYYMFEMANSFSIEEFISNNRVNDELCDLIEIFDGLRYVVENLNPNKRFFVETHETEYGKYENIVYEDSIKWFNS